MVTRTTITLRGDRNQCPDCGALFNSTYAFDKHRVGIYEPNTRRCLTPDEMLAKGMVENHGGFWVSAPMPMDGSRRPVVDAETDSNPLS